MDRFPDGMHVWLQSRVRRGYLHADEDGLGVSLTTDRATLNAAWQVHRIERDGATYVLLRCAAYGRYLALSASAARDGHRGYHAAQSDFSEPYQVNLMWRAVSAGSSGDVLLSNLVGTEERYLRANGRYLRWNNGVTADVLGNGSKMMRWTVQQIPPRPSPPALPNPSTRRARPLKDLQRTIRYIQVNDEGRFIGIETFCFPGRSVLRLKDEVARQLGEGLTITLCVHAGFYGRLTPLLVDLPRSEDLLDIVVLSNTSTAALGLRHPDVNAPDPTRQEQD